MDKITKLGKYETENGYIIIGVDECDNETLVIEDLEAYEKKKGTGKQLVKMAVDFAETEGKRLSLCAHPTYDEGQEGFISFSDLVEFYENNGFCVDCVMGDCAIMYYNF